MSRKGIGRTLDRYEIDTRIVETIAFNKSATIEIIANETGLSYTAVRNSLRRLVTLGVVEETYLTEGPSRRGRPATFFRLDKGLKILIPPRQFQHLATTIIEQLVQEQGETQVANLLDRAASVQAQRLVTTWKSEETYPDSITEMLERICEYINQQGCYATHSPIKDGFYIQVNNCVYEDVATSYPGTICHFHGNLIEHLITNFDNSVSITHEKAIAKGDAHCRYVIIQA